MILASATQNFASDPLWHQAQICLSRGQTAGARKALAAIHERGHGSGVHAHLLAAQIAWCEDRIRDSARHALDAARETPDDPEVMGFVAGVLLNVGESAAAREYLDRPALAACEDPLLLMRLATLRKRLDQQAEALVLLDKAKSLGHADPALRYMRGVALSFNGRLEEAEAELASSLSNAPNRGNVAVPLVRLRRQTRERNYIAALNAGARVAEPGTDDQAAFEFARYKTMEDLGRHDEAWRALARGNAQMHARLRHMTAPRRAWLENFVSAWQHANVQYAAEEQSTGPMPIFIVGMPRSGTTLLERMLSNHSNVAPAGELMDFGAQFQWVADTRDVRSDALVSRMADLDYGELGRRYLAQTQWRVRDADFFIDKRPPNWVWAGAIHAALPRAPILNLVREPMDVCFSNWRAYFGDACAYSYDLNALAVHFKTYQHAMARWRRMMPGAILDVPYAGLVRDPEATLRQIFDFCGLAWESGCTDIERNVAPSATLSAVQVRQAIRTDTSERWRHYAAWLAPLRESLEVP